MSWLASNPAITAACTHKCSQEKYAQHSCLLLLLFLRMSSYLALLLCDVSRFSPVLWCHDATDDTRSGILRPTLASNQNNILFTNIYASQMPSLYTWERPGQVSTTSNICVGTPLTRQVTSKSSWLIRWCMVRAISSPLHMVHTHVVNHTCWNAMSSLWKFVHCNKCWKTVVRRQKQWGCSPISEPEWFPSNLYIARINLRSFTARKSYYYY